MTRGARIPVQITWRRRFGPPVVGIERGRGRPAREGRMISTGDLKKGVSIEMDGQLFTIVDWQHIKMGRGGAIVRIKLRNLRSGSIIDRTFDAGERFQRAYLDHRNVVYQYNDGDRYY